MMRWQESGSILAMVLLFCLIISSMSMLGYRQLWLQLHAQHYMEQHVEAFEQAMSSLSASSMSDETVVRKVGNSRVILVMRGHFFHQSWWLSEQPS